MKVPNVIGFGNLWTSAILEVIVLLRVGDIDEEYIQDVIATDSWETRELRLV